MYIYMIIYTQAKLWHIVTVWSYLVLEDEGLKFAMNIMINKNQNNIESIIAEFAHKTSL